MKRRILNILISLDQFLWVLGTLGGGYPDETISAAMWRMETQCKRAGRIGRPVVDWLFSWLESDHCYKAWVSETNGSQLNPAYAEATRQYNQDH